VTVKVSSLLSTEQPVRSLIVRTVTGNTTVQDSDDVIITNGDLNIQLPLASARAGVPVQIKNINNLNVAVLPANNELIDSYTRIDMRFNNSSIGLVSDGTTWVIV
jgi:hypothetical protein